MKPFSLLVTSVLCSTVFVGSTLAQGTGGSGGSSGGGTPGSGGSSPTPSSSASGSSASPSSTRAEPKKKGPPPEAEAVGKSGGPVSPANLPARAKREEPKPPAEPLPEGLTVPPPQPGISPVSGLPTAELPVVSPGTQPLGPKSRPATPPPGAPVTGTPPITATMDPGEPRPTLDATRTTPTHLPAGRALPTEPRAPVTVPSAPPVARAEMVPPALTNERGERWIAGHHSWSDGKWQWVEGGWQRLPAADAEWIAGHYDAGSKRWTEGYWRTHAAATPATEPKPVK